MQVVDQIIASPSEWTGRQVVDALSTGMYEGADRTRDPGVPLWLREIMIVCDFETHVLMEGLLGWWENRAWLDFRLVCAALRAIGLVADARVLEQAAAVLDPNAFAISRPGGEYVVSTLVERHPGVAAEQMDVVDGMAETLCVYDPSQFGDGPDLYDLLAAHAAEGLRSTGVE